MAAPCEEAVTASGESDGRGKGFGSWLDGWLEVLGVDQAIYGAYILGVLQEEEEEEKLDALQGVLSAFLEKDSLLDICKEIVERWSETQNVVTKVKKDEVQAIAILIEKQAQIVVKPRVVSKEEKRRKAALLAHYADVTDEKDEADEKYDSGATMMNISSDKSLFRNTNVGEILKAWKLEQDSLPDESQGKKEQNKLQKERNKLAKQERKEKKKTQRGARKR